MRSGRQLAAAAAAGMLLVSVMAIAVISSAAAATTPSVTGVSPPSGLTLGSTTVTVTGTGLLSATAVDFGVGHPGFNLMVGSDTSLTVMSPGGPPGTVDVIVVTPTGVSPIGPLDHFTYVAPGPPASVTGVTPDSGLIGGGASVDITGSGFTGTDAVDFGANPSTLYLVKSDTLITAISPAGAAGVVDVTVTTPNGASPTGSPDQFTYVNPGPGPTVTAVTPNAGTTAGGIPVAVTGTAFTGANTVSFGTVSVPFVINSDTSITATAPVQRAGVVDVTVTTPNGTSPITFADQYTVTAPVPVVTSVSPSTGTTDGGDSVTVSGSGFVFATAVNFGTTPATTFNVDSDTSITVTSPPGTAGVVDITVTTAGGTSATGTADQFTYFIPPPVVTGVSPATGSTAGGTAVTITGSGFGDATAVTFGTVQALHVVVTHFSITATSPAQPAGTVHITVTTSVGTSKPNHASRFTYSAPPVVALVKPPGGPSFGGATVTIRGSSFHGTTAVDFGNVPASSFTVNSDGSISATSPAQGPGVVNVSVITDHGTSTVTAKDQYTVANTRVPVITSVDPKAGFTATKAIDETSVTITGTGFTAATAVDFVPNPQTGPPVPAASFAVVSDTSIQAMSPLQSTPATFDVTVTTPEGTNVLGPTDLFSFVDKGAPVASVNGVSPDSAPNTGGSTVVISGTGLVNATILDFGTTPVPFTYDTVSGNLITTSPKERFPALVDVTVTTPNGVSVINPRDQFTFTNPQIPPVVNHVNPHRGPAAGGTVVIIRGSGFFGATVVRFGTVPASFVVNSNRQITATSPAESAGTVDVTVKTANGTSVTGSDQFTFK